MTPIRDLDRILANLSPTVRGGRWVFVTLGGAEPADLAVAASIDEGSGRSAVISEADAERLGLEFEVVLAWIECAVDSSLTAVGVTAAVAPALGRAAIACNVIAGARHDHLFVPIERREDALAVLDELGAGSVKARPTGPRAPRTDGVEEIAIRDAEIRLGQFLKLAGLVESGAAVKPLLLYGRVTVNGERESRRGRQLSIGDIVTVDGRSIAVG